jgi:putative GTP pyrophosphokinase
MADHGEYERATEGLDDFGRRLQTMVEGLLRTESLSVNQVTYRVKTRQSAEGKVRDHPDKYGSIADLTDMLGVRIITYFPDQVDDVAAIIEREFDIDYENSVDKRTALDVDRFGYLSVHYVGTLNQARAVLAENDQAKNVKIEFQIRTHLQHAWAEIEHDFGYKTQMVVPRTIRRRFCRLAGLLEVADTEFQAIRDESATYAARVTSQIRLGAGNLPIDRISLMAFIKQSPKVSDLDEELALVFGSQIEPEITVSVPYSEMIAEGILPLGIETIAELASALKKRSDAIVEFARGWVRLGAERAEPAPRGLTQGISLFYLTVILAIEIFGDDGSLDNWIESSLGLKEGTADEFRMAYNVTARGER